MLNVPFEIVISGYFGMKCIGGNMRLAVPDTIYIS